MTFDFLLGLALLFLLAKILGELVERIGLPSLLGELGAGIILGPSLLHIISPHDVVFEHLAEIGIILLLFVAGFEHASIREILKYKGPSIVISALSSTMPILAVVAFALSQGYTMLTSLFLAVALGATSMGVSVRALLDVGRLDTKPGKTVMGSLVLNDVTGLLLLAVVSGYAASQTGGGGSLLWIIAKILLGIAGFFVLFIIAHRLIPHVIKYTVRLKVEEAQFTLAIIVVLIAAYLAKNFGLSTIIGAFLAGMTLSQSPILETAVFAQKISSLSYGFFIPIFFAITGARISLDNLLVSGKMALIFLALIATVQITCAFLAARFFKYKVGDSLLVGVGMLPYGEVTLIVMSALLTMAADFPGVYGSLQSIELLFSSVLILIALSIIIAPLLMKIIVRVWPHAEA